MNKLININGQLMDFDRPRGMGILNVTPDSFYADSRSQSADEVAHRVHQILDEGGDIIDIGAYSSRPFAEHITPDEEISRLRWALDIVRREAEDAVLSVDTFRSDVAKMCVEEYDVAIINDISGGEMDKQMFATIAELQVPYILMHMKGTPQDMQVSPTYEHLMKEVLYYFSKKMAQLRDLGVNDIIIDPGFGFGKTVDDNYLMLEHLEDFQLFEVPLLVGVSRKSMIYKVLGGAPETALNGTTALNTVALMKGADILRVHDVREAKEVISIVEKLKR